MGAADRYDNSYRIGHTPGLLFFRHGDGSILLHQSTLKRWRKLLLTKISSFIDKIATKTEIGELKQKHQQFLVFYGTSRRNLKIYQSFANLYPGLRHYVGSTQELLDHAGGEKIIFYNEATNTKNEFSMESLGYSFSGDNNRYSAIDPLNYYAFMTENFFDKVMKFDNIPVVNRVLTKQITCVWLFYDSDESTEIRNKFYDLGNKENSLQKPIHFVDAEVSGNYVSNYMPILNLRDHK